MEYFVGKRKAAEIAGKDLDVGESLVFDDGGYIRCNQHPLGYVEYKVVLADQ